MKIYILTEKKLKKMIESEVKRIDNEYQLEILKKQADIASLQGQINPHFLYNALECIRGQALINDMDEIADITESLAKFFRYSISTKHDVITLHDELENVNNYMKVQKYRFGERFKLSIEISKYDDVILDMRMPKLILQPIVENAIIHAFNNKMDDAIIRIKIKKYDNAVKINIIDNGEGMTPEELTRLLIKINQVEKNEKNNETKKNNLGIAMNNVSRRIRLFYGQEATLSITSMEKFGTNVELFLPVELE